MRTRPCFAALAVCTGITGLSGLAAQRPNILLIVTDDQAPCNRRIRAWRNTPFGLAPDFATSVKYRVLHGANGRRGPFRIRFRRFRLFGLTYR